MAVKKDVFFIQEEAKAYTQEVLSEEAKYSLNIPILEIQRQNGYPGGTVFKTILQEANALNNNKRVYKFDAIDGALKSAKIKKKLREGTLYGELDHPSSGDPIRFSQVPLKEASFRILETEWNGNVLSGVCETLATANGRDMRGLIVENGIKLGFSLRAMGRTQVNNQTGLTEVVSPMTMFCYDCVSDPSHSNATLTQVLKEDTIFTIASTDAQKNILMENEETLKFLTEQHGFNFEALLEEECVGVNTETGLAAIKMDNTLIQAFVEEDTLTSFLKTKRKYFI